MTHSFRNFFLMSFAGKCLRRTAALSLTLSFSLTFLCFGHSDAGRAQVFGTANAEAAAFDDFSGKRLPMVRITLDEKGFSPTEISRPQGPFILSIHNRTKIDDLALNLSRGGENKIQEMNFRRQRLDWRKLMTLPSGSYLLSVPSRPAWKCNIVIK